MAKTSSKGRQANYANYKSQNRFMTNRKRKLLKVQKEQPLNAQVTEALANIKYRRKTPGTTVWLSADKTFLTRMLQAGCKPKKKPSPSPKPKQIKLNEKTMFSLGMRAHNKGEAVWNLS